MVKRGEEQPGAGRRRTFWAYGPVGLAALACCGMLSLGAVGCSTSFWRFGWLTGRSEPVVAAVRHSPDDVAQLLKNVRYFKLMGRPSLALRELEQAHRQDPDNLKLVNVLARNYEELGRYEVARELYREALSRQGPNPVLANNLAFTYYLEGRWEEAEAAYRQALAADPGNTAARNNLGLLYCRVGRQPEARQLWEEAEGEMAATAKLSQALAALGRPTAEVYAAKPVTAPGAKATAAPVTAASKAAAPTVVKPPAPMAAPAARVVAKRPGAKPRPATATPPAATTRLAVKDPAFLRPKPAASPAPPPKMAMVKAPPVAAAVTPKPVKPAVTKRAGVKAAAVPGAQTSGPAPAATADKMPKYLTCAELVGTAIEVRNGTWTRNLAHETRSMLSREGFRVDKIGNHIDFGATETVIYYRPGAERVARAVGRTFFPGSILTPAGRRKLKRGIDIKILLGADLVKRPQLMARLAHEER